MKKLVLGNIRLAEIVPNHPRLETLRQLPHVAAPAPVFEGSGPRQRAVERNEPCTNTVTPVLTAAGAVNGAASVNINAAKKARST
jgi:hypothetical protein